LLVSDATGVVSVMFSAVPFGIVSSRDGVAFEGAALAAGSDDPAGAASVRAEDVTGGGDSLWVASGDAAGAAVSCWPEADDCELSFAAAHAMVRAAVSARTNANLIMSIPPKS
jgi:hypothetical protein